MDYQLCRLILLFAFIYCIQSQNDTNKTSIPSVPVPVPVTVSRTESTSSTTTIMVSTVASTVTPSPNPVITDPVSTKKRSCTKSEKKFIYTPCDKDDNRWRVQVPTSELCHLYNPIAPVLGRKCSFTCQPGEYLDINLQNCQKCPDGTFSLGDGKRYASWSTLPAGFSTSAHGEYTGLIPKKDKCKTAVWEAKGNYLESNGSYCRSILKYEVKLSKPGKITFKVKSGTDSAFFHVWVEGSDCTSSSYSASLIDKEGKVFDMYYTMSTSWQTFTLDLHKGHNIVIFVASYFGWGEKSNVETKSYDSNAEKTVMIKEIVVRGFSYSFDCEPCEAGTYSGPGSAICKPCAGNTYSQGNAASCIECGLKQYAPPHSKTCFIKKSCTKSDYHASWDACRDKKTKKRYLWNSPHICSMHNVDSVELPKSGKETDCPSCNPGLYNNGTDCIICPKNHYSNGIDVCRECQPQTTGVPGLFFNFWTHYPGDALHLYCLSRPADGCRTVKGWTMHDSYLSSGIGHSDDAELILYVVVPAFTKEQSEFQVKFEIESKTMSCRLKIQEINSDRSVHTLKKYEGPHRIATFIHRRNSQKGVRYRIIFEKKYEEDKQSYKYTTSQVKIYSIEVTNALNGGAQQCEKCASDGRDCIECKQGEYITADGKCSKCPANTYLIDSDNPVGRDVCKACPVGSISEPGSVSCHSECQITVGDAKHAKHYNFTELAGTHVLMGHKRFTGKGYPYYHAYKVSLCGKPYEKSVCVNNATKNSGYTPLKAAVCRSTIIPDNHNVLSAQSISIGENLHSVTTIRTNTKKSNESTDLLKSSSTDHIIFEFHSKRVTEACQKGSSGIVKLVCDPLARGKGILSFGDDACRDSETCDGCNYIFTWKSMHACPKCSKKDYEVINTACQESVKKVHYVWKEPHVCFGGIAKPADTQADCTIFEKSILDFKVVIFSFLLGAIVLASVVVFLCYRNRSLSYRYHRLVDAGSLKGGELPPSEKCALEDGEEEEDEVILARGKSSSKILDRLKGLGKNKRQFSEFETINLDSIHYSEDDDDEL